MQYSENGYRLTESFEGCELTAYRDIVGVLTIGYGHTGANVYPGMVITQQQAQDFLDQDVQSAVGCVNSSVRVPVTQNQFDALVDFVFNLGCGSLNESTLLRELNQGNYAAAANQFPVWVYAGTEVSSDLVRRREAERALFLQ